MALDYFIFLGPTYSPDQSLELICGVPGVTHQGGRCGEVSIQGLIGVTFEELKPWHREVMQKEYGRFGLDVRWMITGRYDQTDILEVIERLYRCTAALVSSNPGANLSFMRNGENFYLHNTADRLTLSPLYLEAIPAIRNMFTKVFVIDEAFL